MFKNPEHVKRILSFLLVAAMSVTSFQTTMLSAEDPAAGESAEEPADVGDENSLAGLESEENTISSYGIRYEKIEGGLRTVGTDSSLPVHVIIPTSVDGMPVIEIGSSSFYDTEIKSVDIPGSVKTIGADAFFHCRELKNITLGVGIETIGDWAFDSTPITSLTLPSTLKKIGSFAFSNTLIERLQIPSDVEKIGNGAFFNCIELRRIALSEGLLELGDMAFSTTLVSRITMPSTLTTLGEHVFDNCVQLKVVYADENTLGAEYVQYPVNVKVMSTAVSESKYGSLLYRVDTTPDGTQEVSITGAEMSVPRDCVIPPEIEGKPVTAIEDWAFTDTSITTISLPPTLKYMGMGALSGTDIQKIKIPASVNEIGESVFLNCKRLLEIEVEKGNEIYYSTDGVLFSVNQEETVRTLLSYPAGKVPVEYTVPDGVTNIAADAFNGAMFLSTINLDMQLRVIGKNAFTGTSIKTIIIPKNVAVLDPLAFDGCSKLESICTFQGTYPAIALYPDGIARKTAYEVQFLSSDGLTVIEKIMVPDGETVVVDIGEIEEVGYSYAPYFGGQLGNTVRGVSQDMYLIPLPEEIVVMFDKENDTYLSSIKLPEGFEWNDPETVLEIGRNEYSATYIPADKSFEPITDVLILINVQEYVPDGFFDRDDLIKAIEIANSKNASDYTENSYETMRLALLKAEQIVDNYRISPEILDMTVAHLNNALVGLRRINTAEDPIGKITVTITPASDYKFVGETDPIFRYSYDGLDPYDMIVGQLARELGEEPGTYKITLGSIQTNAPEKYNIVIEDAYLVIFG